jgi:hypothetical protein
MIIHVDDCFVVGHSAAIDETIELIKNAGLELKIKKNATDYLGCEIIVDNDNNKAWMGQQNMINKIEKNFGDLVKQVKHQEHLIST